MKFLKWKKLFDVTNVFNNNPPDFEEKIFTKLLPYISINPISKIFENTNSYGFIFEIELNSIFDNIEHKLLNKIILQALPHNSSTQIMLQLLPEYSWKLFIFFDLPKKYFTFEASLNIKNNLYKLLNSLELGEVITINEQKFLKLIDHLTNNKQASTDLNKIITPNIFTSNEVFLLNNLSLKAFYTNIKNINFRTLYFLSEKILNNDHLSTNMVVLNVLLHKNNHKNITLNVQSFLYNSISNNCLNLDRVLTNKFIDNNWHLCTSYTSIFNVWMTLFPFINKKMATLFESREIKNYTT